MKILVVDDHPLVRKGLISTIKLESAKYETKEASNVKEALEINRLWKPDMILVDIFLGKENGMDLVIQLKSMQDTVKVIMITSSCSNQNYLRAKSLNVDGYILKDAFIEDILYALKVVERGKRYIDPQVLQYVDNTYMTRVDDLTEREKEVLFEIGEGSSNKAIAKSLYISECTVKKHISSILSKLELNNRTEAALFIKNQSKKPVNF